MCGICGYVGAHRPELLEAMCNAMTHRGPDDSGTWCDEQAKIGLGHRRLSIIDLTETGHQPMSGADGAIQLSYNGEIYNFPDHREDLIKRGYRFRGQSDTEVLLYMYEEYGLDFLGKLNGIFALAIWDSRTGQLILARDHAGVKPLYYWKTGEKLFFASEIKSLLRIDGIGRELNEQVIPAYLTFLWVPGRETMLKSVSKLEPGHILIWKDGRVETRQWFNLDYDPDESVPEAEWIERVHDTFMRTTRRQMVSDVPLGAFLSGGLDSSSIVACMRHAFPQREITCYTMAYDPADLRREGTVDDFPYAKRVAKHLDVNLKSLILKPDVVDLLGKIVYHMDEPDADPTAILTYLVSKLAHQDGTKVLLSGTGGDEVFFGYRSHQALARYKQLRWIPRRMLAAMLSGAGAAGTLLQGAQGPIGRRMRKFKRGLMSTGLARHLAIVDWSSPQVRGRLLSGDLANLVEGDGVPACMRKYYDGFMGSGELNRHSHVLNQTFLAAHNFLYTDKCSMAESIETRVPFMDVELMQLCARIPERYKLSGNTTKHVLKKAMERYLPKDVIYRAKTGFAPPLREWIVNGLDGMIRESLGSKRLKARGLFDPDAIDDIIRTNRANRADHGYLIYALLSLEIWQQTFIDSPGVQTQTSTGSRKGLN